MKTILTLVLIATANIALAHDAETQQRIDQVINAAGGEAKLLKLFRFREKVLITATAAPEPNPDDKGNRTSTVEVGGKWWVGTAPRDKDKVRVLCWAWSLRILLATDAKIESLPESQIGDKTSFGLRVAAIIKEPLDLYFDTTSKQLLAIEYTDTRHVFSSWKKTEAGHAYPSHVTGYRFADRKARTVNEKQWYQTDLLEVTPLEALPEGLK